MRILALLAAAACLLAGCGDDAEREPGGAGADRGERVEVVDGIRYRVVKFRELNLREGPDRRYYRGRAPGAGTGVYAAFVQACNVSRSAATVLAPLTLVDAGGDRFGALPQARDNPFAYAPLRLQPGQCAPRNSTVAEPLSGLVEPFAIPFDDVDDLPLHLELRGADRTGRLRVRT